MMSYEKVLAEWRKKQFKPIYWLEGEEEYYIDHLVDYAENKILTKEEASFNLSIFYGKDANWGDIINACRKYPMFSDRQVVLLKEAQSLRDIEKLEAYISAPLVSTIFVVAYKHKKLDARTKFAKLIKEKGELITTKKFYENELPKWVEGFLKEKKITISPKAVSILVDHIGNDLTTLANELQKVIINLKQRNIINENDIEEFVGISKEYNVYELQAAIANKNLEKSLSITQYFVSSKSENIQKVLTTLYSFFSKVYFIFGISGNEENIALQLGVNRFFVKDYIKASKIYGVKGVENILLLLHQYNLKSIGINAGKLEEDQLYKEMLVKMML